MFRKFTVFFIVSLVFAQPALAGRLYTPRSTPTRSPLTKRTPDTTPAPAVAWKKSSTPVKNRLERGYDKNRDGSLQPAEAKRLLMDRYKRIRFQRNPKVSSSVEAGYDANKNRVLDRGEIEAIRKDLAI